MIEKMNGTLKEYNIKVNQRKTKVMICSRQQLYANNFGWNNFGDSPKLHMPG